MAYFYRLLYQTEFFRLKRQVMPRLFTIGHSNHSLDEFLNILNAHKITHLVDVRTIPKSRRMPWFNQTALQKSLRKVKISYLHIPQLGGLRPAKKDSINVGWNNPSFRGFADYMQTPAFYSGLKELNQLINKNNRVVIMCAEALPWRCHRSLIADAELARHFVVWDIFSKTSLRQHQLTRFALIDRTKRPIQIYYL